MSEMFDHYTLFRHALRGRIYSSKCAANFYISFFFLLFESISHTLAFAIAIDAVVSQMEYFYYAVEARERFNEI